MRSTRGSAKKFRTRSVGGCIATALLIKMPGHGDTSHPGWLSATSSSGFDGYTPRLDLGKLGYGNLENPVAAFGGYGFGIRALR